MKHINLEVNTGEYFVLIGPTGCGKTVFIETLVGIRKPDSGEIWINNQNVTSQFPEERNVGYLPQDFALFPHMTVEENIAFGLKARRKEEKHIQLVISRLADSLNISHLLLRYTQGLSGGEK
ncbi:MAG: ATP-binding cassette domain-containing protein [Candidatus Brocadiaceae bacterium]|nr:ATP-binding cassette domain-containing protein [Candidatus Brocadiaceae bacterium]